MLRIQDSEECTKSELDLFMVPPTQVSVEQATYCMIQPHVNWTNTIQFDITGTTTTYLDLSETQLHMTVSIHKVGSVTPLADADAMGPVNCFMHAMFSQIEVYFGNTLVENSNNTYAYRAYLENTLNHTKEEKNTHLQQIIYYPDTAGKFDTLALDATGNQGYIARRKRFVGKTVQMVGRLHSDIFNINRYLLNSVNVTVKLTRNSPEFALMGSGVDKYSVDIKDLWLQVRQVNVSPSVILAHALALEKTTAKYPIKRVVVHPITIPPGSITQQIQQVHKGILPQRIVLGFVDTEDYSGTSKSNPFYFRHYNIKELDLRVASKSYPYSHPLILDFDKNNFLEGYNSLYQNIGSSPNGISLDDYGNGYTFFAYNLAADNCVSEHFNILTDGQLDLTVRFKTAPDKGITAIVYLEFDNVISITKNRNVLFDWK